MVNLDKEKVRKEIYESRPAAIHDPIQQAQHHLKVHLPSPPFLHPLHFRPLVCTIMGL